MVFTFAPKTVPLAMMHAVGKLFPRSDRSPAIEPISPASLKKSLANSNEFTDWEFGREHRISTGFYTSQAMELTRIC
jgi:magnesium-protoporphyrin O-methyltransferase